MVFADRLEGPWNPGGLPSTLTLQKLREPHGSFSANPLLAEPLYLAKYIAPSREISFSALPSLLPVVRFLRPVA
jgi:hypothetical protein